MYNGIINIYKEKGYTSHDVVAKMRGILKQKKIGHTGTLDPDAEGVLPVCLGSATKLCDMLTDKDKEYVAVMRLGVVTDTQDLSGTVISQNEVKATLQEVEKAIMSFVGNYEQIPPMYSALKVNGKKLYEIARQGLEIEREPRSIMIHEIEIINRNLPDIEFRVSCSKGTYIRTLCHDIGKKLGCGAAMASLTRTRAGSFMLASSITLSEVEKIRDRNEIDQVIIPVDSIFSKLSAVHVAEQYMKLLENGNRFYLHHILEKRQFIDEEEVRVYSPEGRFFGIYTYEAMDSKFKPIKMFF